MRKIILGLLVFCFVLASCSKVPITNRRQVNLLPESQLASMSLDAYQQLLGESKLVKQGTQYDMVQNTGNRISQAVETYLKTGKYAKRVKDFKWEFNLIDNEAANAFAMPGGKVAFYTGIMPLTKTETGTAVVMGHEVAHAIARHGNERMSQGLALQLGGIGLAVALKDKPAQTQNLFLQAYGVSSTLGSLKFSRKHESEADKMGLVFMAIAGYDPNEAPKFWERMKSHGNGQQPPEFISTHPSHETRIKDLHEFMPEALKYYKGPVGSTPSKSSTKTNSKTNKPGSNTNSKPKTTKPGSRKISSKPKTKPSNKTNTKPSSSKPSSKPQTKPKSTKP